MVDSAKRTRGVKFGVGNRVSVPRSHFDTGGTSSSAYSQLIPSDVTKLLGTIHRVYPSTRKAYIRWDCDGHFAETYFSDLSLEDDGLPNQVFDFIIEQVNQMCATRCITTLFITAVVPLLRSGILIITHSLMNNHIVFSQLHSTRRVGILWQYFFGHASP